LGQPAAGGRRHPYRAHLPHPHHRGEVGGGERRGGAGHRGDRHSGRPRPRRGPEPRTGREIPPGPAPEESAREGRGAQAAGGRRAALRPAYSGFLGAGTCSPPFSSAGMERGVATQQRTRPMKLVASRQLDGYPADLATLADEVVVLMSREGATFLESY